MTIILSEAETIERAKYTSIARLGDGELRIATGGSSVNQRADSRLRKELVEILAALPGPFLPCIPSIGGPRDKLWKKYRSPEFLALYDKSSTYGSSFISRPDNAPWIDTPEYYESVCALWRDRDVVYVSGNDDLIPFFGHTKTLRIVRTPMADAYDAINSVEEQVGVPSGVVVICAGAMATALAVRLARRGLHTLDMGHIARFMASPGAFAFTLDDLCSPKYRAMLCAIHEKEKWGSGGCNWVEDIEDFAKWLGAAWILDYGSGQGLLGQALKASGSKLRLAEFDPGRPGERSIMPKITDIVVCVDVLEHCEPDRVANVLLHQFRLARKGAFLAIALKPAKRVLPDGRNAHILLQPVDWWLEQLKIVGWKNTRIVSLNGKKLVLECVK